MDPSKEKQSTFDKLNREEQISFNLQEIELIIDELDDKGIDVENFPDELLKDKELWLSCTPTIKEWIFKAESRYIYNDDSSVGNSTIAQDQYSQRDNRRVLSTRDIDWYSMDYREHHVSDCQ